MLDSFANKIKLFYHFVKFAFRYWETLGTMERARKQKENVRSYPKTALKPPKDSYDLVIIGCGPAGLAAAIYASRQQLDFLVISKDVGGQTNLNTYSIENYLGYHYITGVELEQKFEEHLKSFGVNPQYEEVKKIVKTKDGFNISTNAANYATKVMVIATGRMNKILGVPGELDFQGRGVSYCAHCDGPLFKDKPVAVVGAGKSGLDTAAQMINLASKVYLVDIASQIDYIGQTADLIKSSPKVEVMTSTKVKAIVGDKFVKGMKVMQNGKERQLDVSGIFVNVGFIPSTGFLQGFLKINDRKEIVTDKFSMTSMPGVFAAGDCTDVGEKQVIVSAGEGAKALIAASEYLAKIKSKNPAERKVSTRKN